MAAAYDGQSTDYIFYDDSDDHVIRALYYGQQIGSPEDLGKVAPNSKLSAAYDTSGTGGAVVYYQESNNPKTIGYQEVDRNGQNLRSGSVG